VYSVSVSISTGTSVIVNVSVSVTAVQQLRAYNMLIRETISCYSIKCYLCNNYNTVNKKFF